MNVGNVIAEKLNAAATKIRNLFRKPCDCSEELIADERGESYVGEAIKILIAVVIGALLLTLLYTLMKDTVFATVTAKITELFSYSGT